MKEKDKIIFRRYVNMNLFLSNIDQTPTWIIGGASSILLFLMGNIPEAVWILVAIMVVDIITGVLKGVHEKNIQSRIMAKGVAKKAGIISAVILGFLLDKFLNLGSPLFTNLIIGLSVGSESISVIENLDALGVKIPIIIKDKILSMANPDNKEDSDSTK